MFGVGSNPTRRKIPRMMLWLALAGTRVWVRDEFTANLLMEQWRKRTTVAADTALMSRRRIDVNEDGDHPLVVAAYAAEIAQWTPVYLGDLRAQFGALEFISMHQGERADADSIPGDFLPYFTRIHRGLSVTEAANVVGRAEAVLSSRMHALYLGLHLGKPLVALSQRPKVISFQNEFDIPTSDPGQYTPDAGWTIEPRKADATAVAAARERLRLALDELVAHIGGPRAGCAPSTPHTSEGAVKKQTPREGSS